ncbi:hypothetical protein ACFLZW_00300 [Chloroflexota bacterium]
MAGFDAISKHIELILFSIALDLLLWFSPRVRLTSLLESLGGQFEPTGEMSGPEVFERLTSITEGLNLLSSLRTFPVGVPSLMASRPAALHPLGAPLEWELPSLWTALGLWLLINFLGLLVGSLYFSLVAQAAISDKIHWRLAFSQWPRTSLQVLALAAFWFVLLTATVFPFLCFFSFILTGGMGLEQLVLFGMVIFGLLWIWLLLPFFYSPHGIFGAGENMWNSLRKSFRLARATLPSTALLLLTIVILSEGLRQLWILPSDTSWWMLVGMAGHAFVTASLLAASFVFYKDAELWVKQVLKQTKSDP